MRGSFLPTIERNSGLGRLKPTQCVTNYVPITMQRANIPCTSAQAASVSQTKSSDQAEPGKGWNVAAILRGDGEFHLSCKSYFGSSSLHGAVSGSWPLIWDSLTIKWAPKMHHHLVYWPDRAVTRNTRLLRRKSEGLSKPLVNTEGYP